MDQQTDFPGGTNRVFAPVRGGDHHGAVDDHTLVVTMDEILEVDRFQPIQEPNVLQRRLARLPILGKTRTDDDAHVYARVALALQNRFEQLRHARTAGTFDVLLLNPDSLLRALDQRQNLTEIVVWRSQRSDRHLLFVERRDAKIAGRIQPGSSKRKWSEQGRRNDGERRPQDRNIPVRIE